MKPTNRVTAEKLSSRKSASISPQQAGNCDSASPRIAGCDVLLSQGQGRRVRRSAGKRKTAAPWRCRVEVILHRLPSRLLQGKNLRLTFHWPARTVKTTSGPAPSHRSCAKDVPKRRPSNVSHIDCYALASELLKFLWTRKRIEKLWRRPYQGHGTRTNSCSALTSCTTCRTDHRRATVAWGSWKSNCDLSGGAMSTNDAHTLCIL